MLICSSDDECFPLAASRLLNGQLGVSDIVITTFCRPNAAIECSQPLLMLLQHTIYPINLHLLTSRLGGRSSNLTWVGIPGFVKS